MDILLLSQYVLLTLEITFFLCCTSHFLPASFLCTFSYSHWSIGLSTIQKKKKKRKSNKEVKFKEMYLRNILALSLP